jgi:hypothetical protein
MALTKCRECGAEISTEAAVCPKCGIQSPALGTVVVDTTTTTSPSARERVIHERIVREPVSDAELARSRGGAAKAVAVVLVLILVVAGLAWYFGYLHIAGLPQPRQVQVKY